MLQRLHGSRLGLTDPRGGRNVNRCQDADNVGLHHAVSRPSTVMTIGKMKGVIVSRIPTIMAPLIILPNKRTARASVRESSLMMLNGSIMTVGFA